MVFTFVGLKKGEIECLNCYFFLFYFHALFNYAVYIKDTYNDMNDEIDLDKVMEAYENEQDIVED